VSAPTFYVFAYGSNLSTARLAERVGRIEVVGAGSLHEHELRFHKQSKDGSTKADAFFTGSPAHRVLGAVYSLHLESKRKLDEFEGLGAGGSVAATVYRARPDRIDTAGRPYDWYREHVLVGAREHGLPAQYVETIESVPVVRDPDEARRDREFAVSRTPSRRS
jgi:hypothetical protein